ncbi:MAG: S8 family serine peptidase, partial [Clostridia bacterium]|nr:S8 family serine peptidase [Clostridia bacterium]
MKKLLAFILSVLMTVSIIPAAVFAADDDGWRPVNFEKSESSSLDLFDEYRPEKDTQEEEPFGANDTVRVSIVLSGAPVIEKFSGDDITQSRTAIKYRSKLKLSQDKVSKKISRSILKGDELDVVWNLTLAANIISANVEYGKIDEIKSLPEVEDVIIESCHEIDDGETTDTAEPDMFTSSDMTNTYPIWTEGYTGAGSSIAVIDTGLDYKHISFDEGAFEYALDELGEEVDLITPDDIASVFDQLNIKAKNPDLTVDDVYLTSKIPFAYNYVDNDTDISHMNDKQGEHGSHVAGIATANRYVPDGNGGYQDALSTVLVQGQAPDAQLIVMKVFGKRGGAFDSDYYAALEDAIVLGLDVANLSLGSSDPGFTTDPEYQRVIDSLESSNTVVTISAGNSSYWSDSTYGGLSYAEDKSLSTTGSPSTVSTSLSVASVDNYGTISPVIKVAGKSISYSETTSYGAAPMLSLSGEYEFVAIDGYGTEEEFSALSDVLSEKIAVCSRGTTSFADKANAAIKNGAAALIIYNNTSGTITMNLTGYEYSAPVIAITLEDGSFIKENSQKVTDGEGGVIYYTGTVDIPEGIQVSAPEVDYYTMSEFSSWGVPGSLLLKPEITAPGGQIYSVFGENINDSGIAEAIGNDKYELMSGTSMASPQIAGISALVAEYIRENDLEAKTGLSKRHLTNALLMGTSRPLIEESSGNYYSVLNQGSGLADTQAVFSTHTFITMDEDATASYADGKVKAELGEISRDDKSFDFTFNINNFGDEDSDYYLGADLFTQDYVEGADYSASGKKLYDEEGELLTRLYMALTTVDLKADAVWTVNGVSLTNSGNDTYDFNGDGIFSYSDVQTVLEYIVGNVDTFNMTENADLDGDGDIDTYDAYLAAEELNKTKITVPAGKSATVNFSASLIDIDDYDINGAYVEGYVFAAEDGKDGVVSSIPVLGYYGSWSDFSMFDHGSYIDEKYGTADAAPYSSYSLGSSAYKTNYFSVNYRNLGSYIYGGNPTITDDVYMPERNAISPSNTLNNVNFALIRNADASETVITDSEGKEIFKKSYGRISPEYYKRSDVKWQRTNQSKTIGFDPSTLEEGAVFTVTFRATTEYYTVKGSVDWNSFSENSRLSQQFTVDGTSPEILSVEFHYDEDALVYDAARITVKDNLYTSFVGISDEDDNLIISVGSDNDPTSAPGIEREIVFDLTEAYDDLRELPDHLLVTVADYAMNDTEYHINLDEEELAEERKVNLSATELKVAIGFPVKVDATVTPWGKNCGIIWSSDNEDIATVDSDGTVNGVGVGAAVIRASAEAEPEVFAELNVSVVDINNTYSGVLWDGNADKWFISFNSDNINAFTKDYDEPLPIMLASLCYGTDGILYGATFDDKTYLSDVYVIDEDTHETTYIGSPEGAGYTDIAAAPAFTAFFEHQYLVGTYAQFLLWIDTDDGEYIGSLDFSDYTNGKNLAGVAFVASLIDEESGDFIDAYYLLDTMGNLYYTEIVTYFDEANGPMIEILFAEDLGKIGNIVDVSYFQSLYLDSNGYLVWSRTNTLEEYTSIYVYDVSDHENIKKYDLGSFEKRVWPVGGIYEKGKSPAFEYSDMITLEGSTEGVDFIGDETLPETADLEAAPEGSVAPSATVTNEIPGAARGAVKEGATREADPDAVSFDLTAECDMKNGLYKVSFASDVYKLNSIESDAEYFAYNLADGVLTIAFVDSVGFAPGDAVATVVLSVVSDGAKAVVVTTEESNGEHPGKNEYLFTEVLPVITSQPKNWRGDWNEYPEIKLTAIGEGLKYKWYFRNADETAWSVSSEHDNCYDSYPLVSSRNGREVYCVVTDANGNKAKSDIATMSLD